jgi:aminomethyltransferase
MSTAPETPVALRETPLAASHRALGARMAGFAGYDMPIQYPLGVLGEHLWTREKAGLFDVSHMGQCHLVARDHATVAGALETLVPADILNLAPGRQRYTQFTTEGGGIIDDLMVTRPADPAEAGRLFLVVNAGRKDVDYAHLAERLLPHGVHLQRADDHALIAIQGPAAEAVLARHCPAAAGLGFMAVARTAFDGIACHISRSGYTGEDGYEISVAADRIATVWETLLAEPEVKPIGLGARDSLRLEAGLCLYGHDIDETTSPVEAGLVWSIQKRRRQEGGFPGAARVQRELAEGPRRLRVGVRPEGRQPAREGTEIFRDGRRVGIVTSGGFGPSVNGPVAMGYVAAEAAAPGTAVTLVVRGRELPAAIATMPFAPHRYRR